MIWEGEGRIVGMKKWVVMGWAFWEDTGEAPGLMAWLTSGEILPPGISWAWNQDSACSAHTDFVDSSWVNWKSPNISSLGL